MNRRSITPILFAIMALTAVLPETPSLLVHAATTSNVFVDPAFSAADVGGTFTISVSVDQVSMLVGYDAKLHYNNLALSCVSGIPAASLNQPPDVFAGHNPFVVSSVTGCSDATGVAEAAAALLGGDSVTVTSPTPLFQVTFKVISPIDSSFTIDAKTGLVQLVSGIPTPVSITTTGGGAFISPPVLLFVAPNATTAPGQRVRFISKGATDVALTGLIQLSPTAPKGGFGGVIFTIVRPDGLSDTVTSNILFMFPGGSVTVTGTYVFPTGEIGTYELFATMVRCSTPTACVNGATTNGLQFKVKF
jgi:hypothetical protein